MRTPNDVLIHGLTVSRDLLARYTADLTPQEYLHHPFPKANCAAWIIGHLILSERKALSLLGVDPLPEVPAGFENRFPREVTDKPADDYGDVTQLIPLFNAHRNRLIEVVKSATPEMLDKPLEKPFPIAKTVGELVSFFAAHVAMHAGQITLNRRSLGRPPLV